MRPATGVGVVLSVPGTAPPSPNWPKRFWPQATTVRSDFRAKLCATPPAIATRSVREPVTTTGTLLHGSNGSAGLQMPVAVPNWRQATCLTNSYLSRLSSFMLM